MGQCLPQDSTSYEFYQTEGQLSSTQMGGGQTTCKPEQNAFLPWLLVALSLWARSHCGSHCLPCGPGAPSSHLSSNNFSSSRLDFFYSSRVIKNVVSPILIFFVEFPLTFFFFLPFSNVLLLYLFLFNMYGFFCLNVCLCTPCGLREQKSPGRTGVIHGCESPCVFSGIKLGFSGRVASALNLWVRGAPCPL